MVVPYAARGPTDTVARVMGIAMAKPLGQTVVFENKPSAGGILAPELDKGTPAALQAHLKAEIDKWAPLIKKAGVYAD